MNILISTIIRNEASHLDRWYDQIKRIVMDHPEHVFALSVYENDSDDNSGPMARGYDWSFLSSFVFTSAKINTPFFIGGKHPFRTEMLAYARNQTFFSFPYLNTIDYVLVMEPDIAFGPEVIERLLNHEKYYGMRLDVFTGKSIHPGTNNIYDSWGTRKTSDQTDWREEDGQEWGFSEWWSTYHCLCLYNAEPIKKGIAFSGTNPRTGHPDCDTVNIVEAFRINGYTKIYSDSALKITHYTS